MEKNKYKTPKIDCENVISLTCSDNAIFPILQLLQEMKSMGEMGCTREIVVNWGRGEDVVVLFDGDGNHQLNNISVNGLTLKEWEKEWKRLADIRSKP